MELGDNSSNSSLKIFVVGIGGAGTNAINKLVSMNLENVNFFVINTDTQDLEKSLVDTKLQIGEKITGGLGAGSFPDIGRAAAEESVEDIRKFLTGADMVFITAGMGGGTGTGAAPIVAQVAKDIGALTVAIITTPLPFEGMQRKQQAEKGIADLLPVVDSLIVVSDEKLMSMHKKVPIKDFFPIADDILAQGVKSITEIVMKPGFINVDFKDVETIMKGKGFAHMGVGRGEGEDKITEAVEGAISNPILEIELSGAKSMLINITIPPSESAEIMETVTDEINKYADPEARIIFGLIVDGDIDDELVVTVIATGLASTIPYSLENNPPRLDEDIFDPVTGKNTSRQSAEPNGNSGQSASAPKQNRQNESSSGFLDLPGTVDPKTIASAEREATGRNAANQSNQDTGQKMTKIRPNAPWPVDPDNINDNAFAIPDFLSEESGEEE